jgi:type III secretory pathway lipoprotein EscJ
MTSMVQVAVAGDVTEAEEIQAILVEAGIESELRPEEDADALAVFVPEGSVDLAQDVIEAMTEPDEPGAGI